MQSVKVGVFLTTALLFAGMMPLAAPEAAELQGVRLDVRIGQAGFEKNQDIRQMHALEARLQHFNSMFGDARKGDVLIFEFLPDGGGTRVVANDIEKGRVPGEDFQRALLAVWLGDHPADTSLKKGMLGLD